MRTNAEIVDVMRCNQMGYFQVKLMEFDVKSERKKSRMIHSKWHMIDLNCLLDIQVGKQSRMNNTFGSYQHIDDIKSLEFK